MCLESYRIVFLNTFRKFIKRTIWLIVGLLLSVFIAVQLPGVKKSLGSRIAQVLSSELKSKVELKSLDIGFFNRLILNDLCIYDQQDSAMLCASRVAVKIKLLPLFKQKISISSAQIFSLRCRFYRKDAKSALNAKFVLDKLQSEDKKDPSPLSVSLGSLVVRNGSVEYDVLSEPQETHFSPSHISLHDINAHLSIQQFTKDSISLNIKQLSLRERSGLVVQNLKFEVKANQNEAQLKDLICMLPSSSIVVNLLSAKYQLKDGTLLPSSLNYIGALDKSKISTEDFTFIVPDLKEVPTILDAEGHFHGTHNSLHINHIDINSRNHQLDILGNGSITHLDSSPIWHVKVKRFNVNKSYVQYLNQKLRHDHKLPQAVLRLGNISYTGSASSVGQTLEVNGHFQSEAGHATLTLHKKENVWNAHVETSQLNLRQILDAPILGDAAGNIDLKIVDGKNFIGKGHISQFTYNDYEYHDIRVDGTYKNDIFDGRLEIRDPNANLRLNGVVNPQKLTQINQLNLEIQTLNPRALNFSKNEKEDYLLQDIHLSNNIRGKEQTLTFSSPYASAKITGQYDYMTLFDSFSRIVKQQLPSFPWLSSPRKQTHNQLTIDATIEDMTPLEKILDIPLKIKDPIRIKGEVDDVAQYMNVELKMPDFVYDGVHFNQGHVKLQNMNKKFKGDLELVLSQQDSINSDLKLTAEAYNDTILTTFAGSYKTTVGLAAGILQSKIHFYKDRKADIVTQFDILPSEVEIKGLKWDIEPSAIVYKKHDIIVDGIKLKHSDQYVGIKGHVNKNTQDSLLVELKDIDVADVLEFVNFDAVKFSGKASARVALSSLFEKDPFMEGNVRVTDFKFQDGNMGVLHANVGYNKLYQRLDIKAKADEGEKRYTDIEGYVSPKNNAISLEFKANNSSLAFMEGFCGSFMRNVRAQGLGTVALEGTFDALNLRGEVIANGQLGISPTNCDYQLDACFVKLVPDTIFIQSTTGKNIFYDKEHNRGEISGAVYHKNLTNLTYKLDINAEKLLVFDTKEDFSDVFYGTIYATGSCKIKEENDDVVFDIEAMPNSGSQIVYKAESSESANKTYITWRDKSKLTEKDRDIASFNENSEKAGDVKMNFKINATPDLTLKVFIDPENAIDFQGSGALHAKYSTSAFTMYGNYLVENGKYRLKNIPYLEGFIEKDFSFKNGGEIKFNGDPNNAELNLKAFHEIKKADLSNLNISINKQERKDIKCLLNIKGTPENSNIELDFELATTNEDIQQAIKKLFHTKEERQQQTVSLLMSGRFYVNDNKNATASPLSGQYGQMAMGVAGNTITQKLNNIIQKVNKNSHLSFTTNISPGEEGFNNALYTGSISYTKNRFSFSGQFGYRDNSNNDNSSIVTDVDVDYKLFKNLNLNFYNKTNERYFIENTLNTQGIGFKYQTDFNTWFFAPKKRGKTDERTKKQKADRISTK